MTQFDGVVGCCDQCGGEIYMGEEYYRINGENVCEDCFVDYARLLLRPFLTGGALYMAESWNSLLQQAVRSLSQACEGLAETIARGEASVKDIRELTTALKELNALHRSLEGSGEDMESATVEVSFDGDGEGWSK